MSPSQFHDDHAHRREINGPRPAPLKINKESHVVQKQTISSSCATSSLTIASATSKQHRQQQPQQRYPVIIYTHSPKIIRTEARDFMALVQKLTGLSRSDDPPQQGLSSAATLLTSSSGNCVSTRIVGSDDGTSSSVVTNENCGITEAQVSASISPVYDPPQNSFFSDIPLFTPTSSDFFCSPQSLYRYPDPVFISPSMGSSFSPSVMEGLQAYREY
ncbi:VQ motif-containing protein 8, chloroplastic-like [Aristolochia californica]|uniref:VQ motif-containing protein 8, chloroplastic-like n=1 Tax=Aristolochia californica TaxID=171875 RepID=UPI0035DAE6F1